MSHRSDQFEDMDLADDEELSAAKPRDEKWELIGGRVVRMMVGARWEHNFIIQNPSARLQSRLRPAGSPCRPLVESFRLKDRSIESSISPDIMVRCGPPGVSVSLPLTETYRDVLAA